MWIPRCGRRACSLRLAHSLHRSLILFTESMTIASGGANADGAGRVCVSNLYNTVASRWSNWVPHPRLVAAMPPKRQTLFREPYAGGNVINGDFEQRTSAYRAEI